MKYFILLFSLCVSHHFAHVQAKLKGEGIVGGTDAKRGEFTYAVSLETETDNICGGGIIGDQYVLTAAHCVIDSWNQFKIAKKTIVAATLKAQTADDDPETVRIDVEKIYVLDEYNPENPLPDEYYRPTADLAVLKLKHRLGIEKNPLLSALKLPESTEQSYAEETAVITGFGDNWIEVEEDDLTGNEVEYDGGSNDTLRYAEARVVANDKCKEHFKAPIYPSHLCAALMQTKNDFEEGVCTGDSGGPLVHNGTTVIGILSGSPIGCTEVKSPAIYTRVSSYLAFVQDILNDKISSNVRVAVLTNRLNLSNETVYMYDEVPRE